MPKINELTLRFLETFNKAEEPLEPGVLLISLKYGCLEHLCACGECGWSTHMSIKSFDTDQPELVGEDDTRWSNGWDVTYRGGKLTISPSIGNFQFPCKSHYFIRENRVEWC